MAACAGDVLIVDFLTLYICTLGYWDYAEDRRQQVSVPGVQEEGGVHTCERMTGAL